MKKELLVVTGATGGLGTEIALYFVSRAVKEEVFLPVFCCRNVSRAEVLEARVKAAGLGEGDYRFLFADLSRKEGPHQLAAGIAALGLPVRCLVNNAASMFREYRTNGEGIEMNMAINFHAAACCAELAAPLVVPGGSVVNILSVSRNWFPLREGFLQGSREGYSRLGNYSRSKLAMSVFTADMAERHPDICVNGVDPGVMDTPMLKMEKWFDPLTDIFFRPFTRKPVQSLPAVVAACENRDRVRGQIFTNRRHFPIEGKIAGNRFRTQIRDMILGSLEDASAGVQENPERKQ